MGEPQQNNRGEFFYRVGTFFLLVGLGLLVFFLLSEAAQDPAFGYFCWSTILLTVGFMFRAQYRKSIPPSGRFGVFKRFRKKKE